MLVMTPEQEKQLDHFVDTGQGSYLEGRQRLGIEVSEADSASVPQTGFDAITPPEDWQGAYANTTRTSEELAEFRVGLALARAALTEATGDNGKTQ